MALLLFVLEFVVVNLGYLYLGQMIVYEDAKSKQIELAKTNSTQQFIKNQAFCQTQRFCTESEPCPVTPLLRG